MFPGPKRPWGQGDKRLIWRNRFSEEVHQSFNFVTAKTFHNQSVPFPISICIHNGFRSVLVRVAMKCFTSDNRINLQLSMLLKYVALTASLILYHADALFCYFNILAKRVFNQLFTSTPLAELDVMYRTCFLCSV